MFTRTFFLSMFLGLASLAVSASSAAADKDVPPVIQALEKQGLTHVREFKVGPDLRGFAAVAGQRPLAIYVTPDGNAIVGTRVSPEGHALDEQKLDELAAKPMSDAIWQKLGSATWVRDGKADAPRIVYTFSDPNCPYCNRFWETSRPWVEAGKVQLRHVIVGVIKADSSTKAAAILGAPDPTAALALNERNFRKGGITPATSVPENIRATLDANQALMAELGFNGTPGIVFQDKDGLVQRINGLPQKQVLADVLGPN